MRSPRRADGALISSTPSWWDEELRLLKKGKYLLLLLLPGLVYYVLFHYVPMYGVTIAFRDFNSRLGILRSPWVGLDHFRTFIAHPYFLRLLRNTFLLSFYGMVFGFPMPILFALLLNELRNEAYKKTVQTISFMPHFIATPALVGMLFLILSPTTGFVNRILVFAGLQPIHFMIEPRWFRAVYILSGTWQEIGWGAILYLAQLSRIDPELYEAATVDGASRLRKLWHISLPGLKPVISVLLILRMGGLLSVGAEKVILMYNPYTYETADVIASFVYRRGLQMGDFSYGTAVGLFNSIISLALVLAANRIAKRVSEWTLL